MPLRLHNAMDLFCLQCPAPNVYCLISDVCKLYRLDVMSKWQEHLGEHLKPLVFGMLRGRGACVECVKHPKCGVVLSLVIRPST